jgi:tetratricopeptide (TPR) repeat protein
LLLRDPSSEAPAREALRKLSKSTDRRIQALAQFQLWRNEVAAGAVNELQIVHWQNRVDELPSSLRGGPCYLLGRAYAGRRDYEMAAAAYLWLPLVDDTDYRLAARACLEAGLALARIGQQAEAQALFYETNRRFVSTSAADEAGELLRQARESTIDDE